MGPDIAKCFNGLFDYGTSIEFDAENAISGNFADLFGANTVFSRRLQHSIQAKQVKRKLPRVPPVLQTRRIQQDCGLLW